MCDAMRWGGGSAYKVEMKRQKRVGWVWVGRLVKGPWTLHGTLARAQQAGRQPPCSDCSDCCSSSKL